MGEPIRDPLRSPIQSHWRFFSSSPGRRNLVHAVPIPEDMRLWAAGQMVEQTWSQIPEHYRGIDVDAFAVMPNHIHGIVIVDDGATRRGTRPRAPTLEQFGRPVSCSIPTIIRGFKAAATTNINTLRRTSGLAVWQRDIYEHIIRDNRELNVVREYILSNPANWEKDEEYVS